jgi:FdhD protein
MGGVPLVASIGAPSSLAVQVAKEFDITLIGFLRQDQFNIITELSTYLYGDRSK